MTNEEDHRKKPGISVEPGPPETVEFKIEIGPPDSYVYSNVSSVSISPLDFRIHFADVVPMGTTVQTKTILGITLPPEHAAGLV
jgi:hypothetical protein